MHCSRELEQHQLIPHFHHEAMATSAAAEHEDAVAEHFFADADSCNVLRTLLLRVRPKIAALLRFFGRLSL